MQFMVQMTVNLPGDWPADRLDDLVERETARGNALMREEKILRIFRVVGKRANFSIWQADTLEELHANMQSLPMHPWMEVEVTPIIDHPSAIAYREKYGALPAI